MRKIDTIVIPVAGRGTRALPFSKEVPKEMIPILDKPVIDWIVDEAIASGIERVVLITAKGKSVIEDYFDRSLELEHWLERRQKKSYFELIHRLGTKMEVVSIRQKEALGLGHAVLQSALVLREEWFGVCLGDEIFPHFSSHSRPQTDLLKMIEIAHELRSSVLGVMEVPKDEAKNYGVVVGQGPAIKGAQWNVTHVVEKADPAPSSIAMVGRYVFSPTILDCLKHVKPGKNGEIQLTDAIQMLLASEPVQAYFVKGKRYDTGSHFYHIVAQIEAALAHEDLHKQMSEYIKSKNAEL